MRENGSCEGGIERERGGRRRSSCRCRRRGGGGVVVVVVGAWWLEVDGSADAVKEDEV